MQLPVTGPAFTIELGSARARVGAVAAVLRSLDIDGVQLVEDFGDDVLPPFGAGITLFPWPNRVRDGKWQLDGTTQQLDLSEPSKGNASHGLLRNTEYACVASSPAAVTLGATVFPQHGWPFTLRHEVTYEISENGLDVTHAVTNLGAREASFAVGAHPYFRIGESPLADLTVAATLTERVLLDERLLPVGVEPVEAGGPYDLRAPRPVGELDLNYAFRVAPGADGLLLSLRSPDGRTVELSADPDFRHLQLYTPKDFPRPAGHHGGTGLAFAAEPMTAPPDALNSGVDLIQIAAGSAWRGSWRVRYRTT